MRGEEPGVLSLAGEQRLDPGSPTVSDDGQVHTTEVVLQASCPPVPGHLPLLLLDLSRALPVALPSPACLL